ncbi:hypothetical protein B0A68_17320 [Flavobacterium reichenbachii]|uniref:Uncharacterized protein n=1 Tax=Flavobacterium reichenbachii TaxID=362418 RepID=A0A085ZIZ3_9FLAO|nr:hypothetical protein IW19_02180 [Flavobacterium reichenbachii]OXB12552.1 hypothetical protein B0A68_17320 [Flavobacterium reichenbachii]
MDLKLNKMKNSFLISVSFLKYQSAAYLFVILWTVLIAKVQSMFVIFKYTELINEVLFFIYFVVVLSSVILLIKQISRIYFSSESNIKRSVWIVVNIFLYYGVLLADLYLASQFRS